MQPGDAKVAQESGPQLPGQNLEQAILAYVREHTHCTFAALVKGVAGCTGQFAVGTAFENLYLWRGMSREAVEALFVLEKMKHISFERGNVSDYGEEGSATGLPHAMEAEDHASPHWLPVLIHARRRVRKSAKQASPASAR